jgi:hypothetical protein
MSWLGKGLPAREHIKWRAEGLVNEKGASFEVKLIKKVVKDGKKHIEEGKAKLSR